MAFASVHLPDMSAFSGQILAVADFRYALVIRIFYLFYNNPSGSSKMSYIKFVTVAFIKTWLQHPRKQCV